MSSLRRQGITGHGYCRNNKSTWQDYHFFRKPYSYHAFQILYWCGLRVGELLALTPQDIDFDNKVIRITKSYQRLEGKDVITDPKTPKSKRNVSMPDFLCDELKDYISEIIWNSSYGSYLSSDKKFSAP